MFGHRFGLAVAAALLATAAQATPGNTASGTFAGLSWHAQSTIVGQTSTAALGAGGDPRYAASMPQYSGVVSLAITYPSGTFGCTGTLLPDRRSIVTAAHCLIGGPQVTAYFYGGNDPDTVVLGNPTVTAITVSQQFVNPGYTGEVIDQNDIAVLRLSEVAPAFAISYGLYGGSDLTGLGYNTAGYGLRSSAGGSVGYDLAPGILRQGDNSYDYRVGDSAFAGQLIAALREEGDTAQIDYSYLADFDNGLSANNGSCIVAASFGLSGARYCGLGRGASEVGIAPGDSGSAQFVDGLIASIASYALTFDDGDYGDYDDVLNGSWGEFGGYVPISIHRDFILSSMVSVVPEPASWALLVGGFGLAGTMLRRRPVRIAAA